MASEVQRKLTTILCADVVGNSRLMGGGGATTTQLLRPIALWCQPMS